MLRAAGVLFFCAPASLLAGSGYTVVIIPPPPGFTNISLAGINNYGQVAGTGQNPEGVQQAFMGSPAGSAPIPIPAGWTSSTGLAINDLGQIAGLLGPAGNTTQAFIGTTAGSTVLPVNSVYRGSAIGINNAGQVTGTVCQAASCNSGTQAFIATSLDSILIPFPSGFISSSGKAINSSGQVTGSTTGFTSDIQSTFPFIGTASDLTPIPVPTGLAFVEGDAINDSGQMAGYFTTIATLIDGQPFVGTTAGIRLLPLPVHSISANPLSINSSGVVVGWSDQGGWIWDPVNGTRLLNALVPAGWNYVNAFGINNSGVILAAGINGTVTAAFELVPITPMTPAPGSWGLVFLGLAALSVSRWVLLRRVRNN